MQTTTAAQSPVTALQAAVLLQDAFQFAAYAADVESAFSDSDIEADMLALSDDGVTEQDRKAHAIRSAVGRLARAGLDAPAADLDSEIMVRIGALNLLSYVAQVAAQAGVDPVAGELVGAPHRYERGEWQVGVEALAVEAQAAAEARRERSAQWMALLAGDGAADRALAVAA